MIYENKNCESKIHHERLEGGGIFPGPTLTLNCPLEECLAGFTGCDPIVAPRGNVTTH
jgi:hypothetical protein